MKLRIVDGCTVIDPDESQLRIFEAMDIDIHFVSQQQMNIISAVLNLQDMSKDELQAVRNGVVLAYGKILEEKRCEDFFEECRQNAKMSAITTVIDYHIYH